MKTIFIIIMFSIFVFSPFDSSAEWKTIAEYAETTEAIDDQDAKDSDKDEDNESEELEN
jgi:hypothetical protein